MWTAWSLNLDGDMSLIKGSTIINLVLMCSIIAVFSLILMAKYIPLMCLLWFPLLLFLSEKTTKLSQIIVNGLDIKSTTLIPEIKLFIQIPCNVASWQVINLAYVVKVAIKVYFTLLHDTTSPTSTKIYPDVDLHEAMQLEILNHNSQ